MITNIQCISHTTLIEHLPYVRARLRALCLFLSVCCTIEKLRPANYLCLYYNNIVAAARSSCSMNGRAIFRRVRRFLFYFFITVFVSVFTLENRVAAPGNSVNELHFTKESPPVTKESPCTWRNIINSRSIREIGRSFLSIGGRGWAGWTKCIEQRDFVSLIFLFVDDSSMIRRRARAGLIVPFFFNRPCSATKPPPLSNGMCVYTSIIS